MQLDDLKSMLKAWGHAVVNRHAMTRTDHTTVHVMSKVRDHAPGTKERADRKLVGRDGSSRRMFMAGKIKCGMKSVPIWAVDPVPARNDAGRPRDNPEIAVDVGIPDELRWIDDAVRALERQSPIRGLVVMTEFTVRAGQQAKARMVAEKYGGEFSYSMYRRELEKALEVILWERRKAA